MNKILLTAITLVIAASISSNLGAAWQDKLTICAANYTIPEDKPIISAGNHTISQDDSTSPTTKCAIPQGKPIISAANYALSQDKPTIPAVNYTIPEDKPIISAGNHAISQDKLTIPASKCAISYNAPIASANTHAVSENTCVIPQNELPFSQPKFADLLNSSASKSSTITTKYVYGESNGEGTSFNRERKEDMNESKICKAQGGLSESQDFKLASEDGLSANEGCLSASEGGILASEGGILDSGEKDFRSGDKSVKSDGGNLEFDGADFRCDDESMKYDVENAKSGEKDFKYNDERFADVQMLRYRVPGFEELTLKQKTLVFYLSEAALCGRDILFDQNCAYNLRIRRMLEAIYTDYAGNREDSDFRALEVYLKRVWFSNGIHHHYACYKFKPEFSEDFLRKAINSVDAKKLPLEKGQSVAQFCEEVFPVIFDADRLSMRVNKKDGDDLILTSAENYYGEGVTQAEAERFYENQKDATDNEPVMYGLNSRLVKKDGELYEKRWVADGLYGAAIKKIVYWLRKASTVADSDAKRAVIDKLIEFYESGDLRTFDAYSILWLKDTESIVDFTNGFIESYGDPLGLKASWEALANFKDLDATKRTEKLSSNAQWFEDNSPVDRRFKKSECKGISAKVITAAILGGDLYPSTAIGINLPNSNWIRKQHGSKSVTIGNLTDAYNKAAHGNGFNAEFIADKDVLSLIDRYGDACDDLHTDLHECLGHGSGKLLDGVGDDALKAYGSTIEETRADLFALYYLADDKLVELGLTPNNEAYKSEYYHYMMNGLMTQLVRIEPGKNIEEDHMRNRALIANWVYAHGKEKRVVEFYKQDNKTYIKINDYEALRSLFGQLLVEVQRIKSEGDVVRARELVEAYGVKVDPALHQEVLERYAILDLAPYKGFINPRYTAIKDSKGNIVDVKVEYDESYEHQMLRYSKEYGFLPSINE